MLYNTSKLLLILLYMTGYRLLWPSSYPYVLLEEKKILRARTNEYTNTHTHDHQFDVLSYTSVLLAAFPLVRLFGRGAGAEKHGVT